jgi:hypothetical protein
MTARSHTTPVFKIFNCLNEIADICYSFCTMLAAPSGLKDASSAQPFAKTIQVRPWRGGGLLGSSLFGRLRPLFRLKEFQTRTRILYTTFETLQKRQVGSHLEQLLTRINFNNYFAQNNGLLIR